MDTDKTQKTTVTKMANVAILKAPPKMVSGNDSAAAKQLTKLFADAQIGMRKIIALGLFAWEIKERQLKHGEFGNWLAAHCPKLAMIDEKAQGILLPRSFACYMDLTKSVLESVGFSTVEKYLDGPAKLANDANLKPGAFVLLPDKKVPEPLQGNSRQNLLDTVDNKTQRQLFLEFKQAEEDKAGNVKKKHGRLKGEGGASKEQRVNAAELEAQERITEKKLKALEIAEWLMAMSDDAGLGEIRGTSELEQLDKAMEQARGYIKHS